jgi:hypothetical protein
LANGHTQLILSCCDADDFVLSKVLPFRQQYNKEHTLQEVVAPRQQGSWCEMHLMSLVQMLVNYA